MKNKSYIGIAFIILVFGILVIPKIIERVKNDDIVKGDRLILREQKPPIKVIYSPLVKHHNFL